MEGKLISQCTALSYSVRRQCGWWSLTSPLETGKANFISTSKMDFLSVSSICLCANRRLRISCTEEAGLYWQLGHNHKWITSDISSYYLANKPVGHIPTTWCISNFFHTAYHPEGQVQHKCWLLQTTKETLDSYEQMCSVFLFFKIINSSTYPVRAFKENSVVCDRHYSPQCSDEWTEVGDIFSCRLKQKIMQPYYVKLFQCGGHLALPALHHRQVAWIRAVIAVNWEPTHVLHCFIWK